MPGSVDRRGTLRRAAKAFPRLAGTDRVRSLSQMDMSREHSWGLFQSCFMRIDWVDRLKYEKQQTNVFCVPHMWAKICA